MYLRSTSMGIFRLMLSKLGFQKAVTSSSSSLLDSERKLLSSTSSSLIDSARNFLGLRKTSSSTLLSYARKLLFSTSVVELEKSSYSVFRWCEYPKVVRLNRIESELYLSVNGKPIPVLTGSTPVVSLVFGHTRYTFRDWPLLTFPDYWMPPPITAYNKMFIVTHRAARKGWHRLTIDAALVDDKPGNNRAACGFIVRNSDMEPVHTGEWMITDNPSENIRFYEMLALLWGLKQIGSGCFPLVISSDNTYIIDLLTDFRVRKHVHDLQELAENTPYDVKYLILCQKIIQLIEAHLIRSGWSWNEVLFSPLPREANYAADFLANTIQTPGVSVIITPKPGKRSIDTDMLHPILYHILTMDSTRGFPKFTGNTCN